jgi:uncharacterized repeat protein (TIGR01451 family)
MPTANACNNWLMIGTTTTQAELRTEDSNCYATSGQPYNRMDELANAMTGSDAGTIVTAYTNNKALNNYNTQIVQAGDFSLLSGPPPSGGGTPPPLLIPGDFYMASVDYGAVDCGATPASPGDSVSPEITVNLINGASTTGAGTEAIICNDGPGGTGNGQATSITGEIAKSKGNSYVETIFSGVSQYTAGNSVQIDIEDANQYSTGNDGGYNNLTLWDVTPTVSESVSATPPSGMTPTPTATTSQYLTYTITNTKDNLAKNGWSFTDQLPTGLTVVGLPYNTCEGATPTASGNTISDTGGNLPAGAPDWTSPTWPVGTPSATPTSCTITVQVTSANPNSYTDGDTPAREGTMTTLSGLVPTNTVTITFGTKIGGGGGGPTSVPVSKGALGLLALLLAAAAYPLSRRAKKRC